MFPHVVNFCDKFTLNFVPKPKYFSYLERVSMACTFPKYEFLFATETILTFQIKSTHSHFLLPNFHEKPAIYAKSSL